MSGSIYQFQSRFRNLTRFFPISEAAALAAGFCTGEKKLKIKHFDQNVVIRMGTSDFKCLEKVFISEEYKNPFPIKPRVIVDAGANIGMTSLYFAHEYPGAKIIAIEPEPQTSRCLKRNTRNISSISLLNGALWNSESRIDQSWIRRPKNGPSR